MSSLRESIRGGKSKRTDFPLVLSKAALLIIDVQRYCCGKVTTEYYQKDALPKMTSNIQILTELFRLQRDTAKPKGEPDALVPNTCGCEVIFVMIQSKTNDGRDLSIDYKLSGPNFAGCPTVNCSYADIFLPSIMPSTDGRGDIVVSKTACSVFNSTNIDYLLRNLFVEQLVVVGQLTDQCVESAVRDAADLGYLVTVVEDACATHTKERHEKGLQGMQGFCRILTTLELVKEVQKLDLADGAPATPSESQSRS
ncbi:isochorismatase family protein [Nitzschia inconspicua]|uniref:Isochorismatase family protein n=1 Tax=Nitzschia inconspicua TaxID=303405 RepID=A0A9K3L6S4_9STRA|nr:isochorismatase family protein [Nitzschia inconspicua]KAG7356512.1 isochorismatase family protein [Nitzschia inconspicua]